MIGFLLRHPIAAAAIGLPSKGSTNISTNAVRFSTKIGLNENSQQEGSEVNAFRHTLWQATITARYGTGIAEEIGNAHEDNPFAISGSKFSTFFSTLEKADETIDLLNNAIGRNIGAANPNANMKELSLITLDYFKKNGLWTATAVTDKKGNIIGYTISQTKISQDQYNYAKGIIQNLNSDGFAPSEQLTQDKATQEKYEMILRAITSHLHY
jgi:hypothetical protein